MINQSENEFYTQFLFKSDAIPQDVVFPLDIAVTFFNNLSTKVREFFISEGVQVPPRPPYKTNHQGNQRLPLVRNAAVESEKKITTIKEAVQPAIVSRHPRTFMSMLGGNPSTQMASLGSNFKYEEYNSMVAEALEEYALASR